MRRRIAVLVAATTALVLLAFLIPLLLLVRAVAADRAVAAATREAESLSALVATADTAALRLTVDQLNAVGRHPVTVYLPDGTVLGRRAPRSPAVELAARGRSATAAVGGGREIVVAVGRAPGTAAGSGTAGGPGTASPGTAAGPGATAARGTAVIRTFVTGAELRRGVGRAWLILGLLAAALVGLGLAVGDRLARSFLVPIGALAAVSRRLAGGDTTARTVPSGPPEIRDVGVALNNLAGRITELLRQERERAADISHRLRTPLTALRLEAEALRDPEEADRVGAGVDALERAVSRVIEDTRHPAPGGGCDAAAVVGDRVAFWSVLAEEQGRALTADVAGSPVPVAPSAEDLGACVDALLGNVFAHTPEGAAAEVRLTPRTEGGARLVVADSGPGFGADPAAAGALRRGASLPSPGGRPGGPRSTGLGLDIARRVAETGGGRLTLGASRTGGARVEIELAAPRR